LRDDRAGQTVGLRVADNRRATDFADASADIREAILNEAAKLGEEVL